MMDEITSQLEMFTTPKAVAREDDPETSWEAAKIVFGIRETQAKVWRTLAHHGPLIDEELHIHMLHRGWMNSESGCRTRRNELVQLGLVEFADEWGETILGNRSRKWRAVPLAVWTAKEFRKHHQIERAFDDIP